MQHLENYINYYQNAFETFLIFFRTDNSDYF